MTMHRGHYVPAAARRDVLKDYRWRLREHRCTSEAMWEIRSFYASWLAHH